MSKKEPMWEELKPYKCPACGDIQHMTFSESIRYETIECDKCHKEFPVSCER